MTKKHITTYAELVEAVEEAKYELEQTRPSLFDATLLDAVVAKLDKALKNAKGKK